MQSFNAPMLVVMCTGNVCRSPMAEALFWHHINRMGLKASVVSRGLAAPTGREPHPYAIEVAKKNGIPIAPEKRASMVTGADMGGAAAIFVMEARHRHEVQRRFPAASGKTFLLGHWQNIDIADPINEPLAVFEKIWQQCEVGVTEWLHRMRMAGLLQKTA